MVGGLDHRERPKTTRDPWLFWEHCNVSWMSTDPDTNTPFRYDGRLSDMGYITQCRITEPQ